MIVNERHEQIKRAADCLYAAKPDWAAFYREILGVRGIVRQLFNTREALAEFEQTETYREIQRMLATLRATGSETSDGEPTRVITVRMPKSLHETLRIEAFEHHTSMNKLCISRLMKMIDGQRGPNDQ